MPLLHDITLNPNNRAFYQYIYHQAQGIFEGNVVEEGCDCCCCHRSPPPLLSQLQMSDDAQQQEQ